MIPKRLTNMQAGDRIRKEGTSGRHRCVAATFDNTGDTMPPIHTCLFTGEVLTDSTKVEHTIPESLGGRIESRIVSSSDCNERSGNYLDPVLKSVYEPLLNHLAPLLPSASQPGKMTVEVPGERSGLYLERGEISRKNVDVKKDDDGKFVSATGENLKSLEKIGREIGKEMKLSLAPATDASFFLKKSPVIAHEIEIAALRSAMLTFDHCLVGNALRFTRDVQLEPIRRFVADAVTTRQIDSAKLHGISLGVQYEKLGLYKRLRQQIAVPPTAFEHVLFAAANSSGHCLDLVWSAFGIDPFGFRLTTSWSGPSFLCAIINPVLKEKGWSGPHFLTPIDELLCAPTNRRSTPMSISSDEQMEQVTTIISDQRGRAYNEAVDLVETTGDEALIDRFIESSALRDDKERSLGSLIKKRLCGIYGRKGKEAPLIEAAEAIVAERANGEHARVLELPVPTEATSDFDWVAALSVYRECYVQMKVKFGLPGDWFANDGTIIHDPGKSRLLGDTPEMK